MIHYIKGNLFTSNARVLVNTVNTVGVMGKGIASDFKKLYPEMFKEYKKLCEERKFDIGKLFLYKTSNKWILNFPTKKHWRSPSAIEYIEKGLQTLLKEADRLQLYDIAMPKLGCGNGGLDWEREVKPIVEKYLKKAPINVSIYEFNKNIIPEHLKQKDIEKWLLSDPENLSFTLFLEDIKGLTTAGLFLNEMKLSDKIYNVYYDNNNEYFKFKSNKNNFILSKEDLKSIFYTLKNIGKLCKQDVYMELQEHSDVILNFISKLSYVIKNEDKIILNYTKKAQAVEVLDFE